MKKKIQDVIIDKISAIIIETKLNRKVMPTIVLEYLQLMTH